MQVLKKFFVNILIGTILILFAVNLIVPRTIAQSSTDEQIHYLTGLELDHMQNGQYQQAMGNIDQIISLNSQMPDVWYERGTMHIAMDNTQSAVTDFQNAKDLYSAQGDSDSAAYMQELIDQYQGS